MATGGCEEASDEVFNFKCTPCARTNKQRKAVKYCVECQGYCCQSCVDMHQAFPTLEGHKLLDQSTGLSIGFPAVPTEICSKHKIKILDMYCGTHDVVGCTSCIALEHRSCADVQLISDIAEDMFKKTDMDEFNLTVKKRMSGAEKIKTSREALLEELNESKTTAVNAIKAFRGDMEKILQNLEKESIKEVENEFQKIEAKLLKEKQISENQMKTLSKAVDEMKQSEENNAQHFVSLKKTQKALAQADGTLNMFDAQVHAKVSFATDQNILEFLQELKTLGSVIRDTAYSVKGTREFNIKVQSDSSVCYMHGSCLTEDGKLLLPDYSNKKLKRADIEKMSVVDFCDLPYNPYDVCSIGNQEAVVTLNNSTIQFVSLGNKMSLARDIKLNHRCLCIACRNNKLYISDNGNSLYVHDLTGTLLQTISKDSSGKDLFISSRHIAFSDFRDKIYVVDGKQGIVTLNGQWNNFKNYSDAELNNTTGVCTDGRGNLFVCGHDSKNVLQLGQNGTKMGFVIKSSDGLNLPWSLAFDVRISTLCVIQDNSDTVKLFDLH